MDTIDARRQIIIDRMEKRDEVRRTADDERRQARQAVVCTAETPKFYQDRFQELGRKVRKQVEAADVTPTGTPLVNLFENIALQLHNMQQYLNESVLFLTTFDMEQSKIEIQSIRESFDQKRQILMPVKKFAFGKKKQNITGDTVPPPPPSTSNSTNRPAVVQPEQPAAATAFTAPQENTCGFTDLHNPAPCDTSPAPPPPLVLSGSEVTGKDLLLARLSHCEVHILGHPAALTLHDLHHCRVYSGPVSGSIFITETTECQLQLACQQLRVHSTFDCLFAIHVTCKAIIEDCSRLKFGPYSLSYPGLTEDFTASGLSQLINNWSAVDDFNHLSREVASPNWTPASTEERVHCAVVIS